MTAGTPAERLVEYFRIRERQRATDVDTVLNGLTDREHALVREAAVMGYVRGRMAGDLPRTDERPFPSDTAILAEVIGGCLDIPDQYPTIAQAGDDQ